MQANRPESKIYWSELGGLGFAFKDRRFPGLVQSSRELRQWQVENNAANAVATFIMKGPDAIARPFEAIDIHQYLGQIDWIGVIGSIHTHDKSGFSGVQQIVRDVQTFALNTEEAFMGVIDPQDDLYVFARHLFFRPSDRIIHNLRTVHPKREVSFLEAFAVGALEDLSGAVETEGLTGNDYRDYLKRMVAETGIIFFHGNLKNDKLSYHGQYNY